MRRVSQIAYFTEADMKLSYAVFVIKCIYSWNRKHTLMTVENTCTFRKMSWLINYTVTSLARLIWSQRNVIYSNKPFFTHCILKFRLSIQVTERLFVNYPRVSLVSSLKCHLCNIIFTNIQINVDLSPVISKTDIHFKAVRKFAQ